MYFYLYIGHVLVLLNFMVMLSHALSNKRQKEQAFSDVLKNITLVNKVLQDLLKNYESLEKIYQSEESLQSDSSLREVDQKFKSFTPSKQNFEQGDKSYKNHTRSPYIGTAMIYGSGSDEKESENTKEEIKEVNTNRKPIESQPDYANDVKVYDKQVINKNREKQNVVNKKYKNKRILKHNGVSKNKAKSKDSSLETIQSDEVEQIVIDIPQDSSSINEDITDDQRISDLSVGTDTPHKIIVKSSSNKPNKNMIGEETRFSIQHKASKRIDRKKLSGLPKMKNNGSRVKKIVYSESFAPEKIWHEIKNRPLALRKGREQIFRKNNNSNKNKTITVLIITNNKEDRNNWKEVPQLKTIKSIEKLDLPKQIVRSEYGATCLKTPLKKCKKALKIVNKNVCKRRFKCKSDFKSDFIQNSKDGCDKEFAYRFNSINKTKTSKEKFSPPNFKELKKKNLKTKQDQRNINVLSKNKVLKHFISLRNETRQDAFLRARKLKDKYEKRCQKESIKKCNNACNYAIKETCNVYTCEKKKKKALKGECKNQCKKAYTDVRKSVKSSSQSDSDNVSESDSDNETSDK